MPVTAYTQWVRLSLVCQAPLLCLRCGKCSLSCFLESRLCLVVALVLYLHHRWEHFLHITLLQQCSSKASSPILTINNTTIRPVRQLPGKQRSDSMYYHLIGWWSAWVELLPSLQYWNRGILTPIRPHHHHNPLCCTKIPCRLLSLSLFLSASIYFTRSPLCLLANSSSSSIPTQGKMSSKLPAGKQKPTSPFRKRGSLQYAASTGKRLCLWSNYKMSCFINSSEDIHHMNALTIHLESITAISTFLFGNAPDPL